MQLREATKPPPLLLPLRFIAPPFGTRVQEYALSL
jgi:hypothetical protein